MFSLKEQAIREYISRIDWKRDNWSHTVIEQQMSKFLGERPTMDVKYEKDVMVNEVSGESKEFQRLTKVSIIYFENDTPRKIEILID